MTPKNLAITAVALLTAVSSAGGVSAQARGAAARAAPARAPAATATASAITGPALPGVCIFSSERAIGTSSVGKAAAARMQQIRAQVAAELNGEQTSLRNDVQTFQGKRASLTPQQLQQQGAPLEQRAQAFENKVGLRQREMEATSGKALNQIQQQLAPIVTSVSASRQCSVVLNGDGAVMAANPAMDLTEAVVGQLNTRMGTISFDRENLANQPAAGRR